MKTVAKLNRYMPETGLIVNPTKLSESLQMSLSDRYRAYGRLWLPSEPIGAVLYLHGIQSHGQWYLESAQRIVDAGFALLLPDRRGSGRNPQQRGHAPSAQQLLQDLSDQLDELHVRTGFERFHLVGVSWGGKLALALYQHIPERIASLTLSAPGLFPRIDLPLADKVRVGLSLLSGDQPRFDIPLSDPALFTANRQYQEFIRNDPLALHKVSGRFLIASRRLDHLAVNVNKDKPGCPLHVFLAGQDRIIDNTKTKHFIRTLRWPQRQITEYPQAHHTLEFEPDPGPYFNDLIAWLKDANRHSTTGKSDQLNAE